MAIERVLVCDGCSAIVAAESTFRAVRRAAKAAGLYRRIGGRDLCRACLESRTCDFATAEAGRTFPRRSRGRSPNGL